MRCSDSAEPGPGARLYVTVTRSLCCSPHTQHRPQHRGTLTTGATPPPPHTLATLVPLARPLLDRFLGPARFALHALALQVQESLQHRLGLGSPGCVGAERQPQAAPQRLLKLDVVVLAVPDEARHKPAVQSGASGSPAPPRHRPANLTSHLTCLRSWSSQSPARR